MKYLKYLLPGLVLAMGVLACVKEYDIEESETINPPPQEIINAHVYGRVINESDQAIEGAEVVLNTREGTETATTDAKGYFEFYAARLNGNSAFLEFKYPGKFDHYRRLSAIKGKWNYTEVRMLEKRVVGTIDAGSGGAVSTAEGAGLSLPDHAVVRQDGSAYTGPVRVAMQWIDPTAEDLPRRIMGDLSGIDNEGRQVALGTYGMMVVELQDNSGNELNIVEGKKAELTYPVPGDIHGTPPQTVPMWSYDEDLGTWIEETVAIYENGKYVSEVSHFSAWNVDWKGETIEISGKVTVDGETGSILTSYQVLVMSPVFGQRGGYLTPDGEFLFWRFPANEEFTLKILNICGDVIYEELYGPYSENTDLGTIDVGNNMEYVHITGTAVDCNDDPIEGALVKIDYGNQSFYSGNTDVNGAFDIPVPYCGSPVDITVSIVDIVNAKVSDPEVITVEQNDIMLGTIMVCDEVDEFISFTIDNSDDYFLQSPPGYLGLSEIQGTRAQLVYEGEEGFLSIEFESEVTGTGVYSSNHYRYYYSPAGGYVFLPTNPPDLTVEITEYSDIQGEIIRGNFNGMVLDSASMSTKPIEGDFKVKAE